MKKIFSKLVIAALVAGSLLGTHNAHAIPALQLDIAGGYYVGDPLVGTTIASGSTFDLYALLLPNEFNPLSDTYYISAALSPMTSSSSSLGSFVFNGSTINATGGMNYGTPPLEALYPDLGPHGVFLTYYEQFNFQFSATNKVTAYDVQTQVGDPVLNPDGTMYYAKFTVDTALLAQGYAIHFDLYNENMIEKTNRTDYQTKFAPFSHDAESQHKVPEPATLLLLGSGLIGLVGLRKFRK